MDQVQVEITGQAITARYGTLSTGTVLRTDAAFAKHLVEDCGAAKYIRSPDPEDVSEKPEKTKKGKAKAAPEITPAPEATEAPAGEATQAATPQE